MDERDAQGATPAPDDEVIEQRPARRRGGNTRPPVGKGSPNWTPKVARERRVTHVFGMLVSGRQRWEITADIAATQAREIEERQKAYDAAVGAGSPTPEADALLKVPLVWGPTPIPMRTQDDYTKRAKALLEAQSGEFVRQRDRQLAIQVARINATYAAAAKEGRHYACLKAVELMSELLDLKGHAKLAALATGRAPADGDGADEPRLLPSDAESRASAFAALIGQSIQADPTLREQIASFAPRTTVMP